MLEVHVGSPSPAGSETGHEAQHPVSTSPKGGRSLCSGTPCRTPARSGPWPEVMGNVVCDSLSWMPTAHESSSVKDSVNADPLLPTWLTPGPFCALFPRTHHGMCWEEPPSPSPWKSVEAPLTRCRAPHCGPPRREKGAYTLVLQPVKKQNSTPSIGDVIGFIKQFMDWAACCLATRRALRGVVQNGRFYWQKEGGTKKLRWVISGQDTLP